MNETIRESQIEWLKNSLRSALFNATLNRSIANHETMKLYPTDGQWYLTQEDLDGIFAADSRDLQGKIVDDCLEIWKPLRSSHELAEYLDHRLKLFDERVGIKHTNEKKDKETMTNEKMVAELKAIQLDLEQHLGIVRSTEQALQEQPKKAKNTPVTGIITFKKRY